MGKFSEFDGFSGRLVLQTQPALSMTSDQFFDFCQINRDLRIERSAEGELVIMAPTGFESGARNHKLALRIGIWTIADGTGIAGDSSTGYMLPNGAERSPDASWISSSRLLTVTVEERRKFLPLCPDFVVELVSPSDRLPTVQAKMEEYIANGARLGWLIDPDERKVHIYRPDTGVEILDNPVTVSGDPELAEFVLDLAEIWEPVRLQR